MERTTIVRQRSPYSERGSSRQQPSTLGGVYSAEGKRPPYPRMFVWGNE
ncbi:hypothetical protein [Bacillus cereus]